jgi:glycine/D-amino acid oxidase-like deaminating enzyme
VTRIHRARNDLDDNVSMWAHTVDPVEPRPTLEGTVQADVVIVGAGFTGLSTAYEMSRRFPDRGIVVLEARAVGNGASGRNGGMMLNWVNGIDSHDEASTKRIWATTQQGMDWITETIRAEGLRVRLRRDGCLETFTSHRRAEEAHAKVERLRGWNIPLEYLQGPELARHVRAEGVVGAILDRTAGQLHGLELVRELARVLAQDRNVAIYEQSPVERIEEGAVHAVHTPKGVVRARTLVLAVNGYAPRLGYFARELFPLHSHCIATAPLPPERWDAVGWGRIAGAVDDLDRISFASMTADGRLLFGGGSNASYDYRYGNATTHPPSERAYDAVRATMLRYFPKLADAPIADRWSGVLGITMNRRPTMGRRGNVLWALGYSGHGVTLANLAGTVLTDLYADAAERWSDLPFVNNRLPHIPPEPFRWVGYQVYTRLTGRSPRRVD